MQMTTAPAARGRETQAKDPVRGDAAEEAPP
jgi:hypothetical protein